MEFLTGLGLLILANVLFFPLKITVVHEFKDVKIHAPQNGKYLIFQDIEEDEDV